MSLDVIEREVIELDKLVVVEEVDMDKLTILVDNDVMPELLEVDNDVIFDSVVVIVINSVKLNLENAVDNDVEIETIPEEVEVDKDVI